MNDKYKLDRNIISCNKCGDIIESKHIHDFVMCSCGAVGTDGGLEYQRVTGYDEDINYSYTVYRNTKNNSSISYDELKTLNGTICKIMKTYKVQSVGNGFIDCICPTSNISDFLEELNELGIGITHFTIWEYVRENKGLPVVGMGGPKYDYGEGWYAEIGCDYFNFTGETNLIEMLSEESTRWNCEIVPGFWLDIIKIN
ncbi:MULTISPECIES: hypothetical protein [unclassified Breznakia]|uniref:DUF7695 domain-containing protein n=1 Tax=unclassified Breznakia TaxID=2623764 RepID=UPI0024748D1F|nr:MULTISPECIES: hypothetical protein [unclassified Breznakia]MDH6367517.1 hypothetical protein [Breznakia sp. PH1-1]MDH6404689.1 hypothetical protein [Breznakia sp. PF1-11]MDH6412347.1 hypothetical protein [Breznakia sp. PFB1-11]MDH6414685.1 hypothetical protein [Breznakia sp. PFB1-14]MDH6417070.1 hypothetical protein [Breznakia sp. PFB1-4]